jgi:hypothetical protein
MITHAAQIGHRAMSTTSGRVRCIGAEEIRAGDVLLGDSISPRRYDARGITVAAVATESDLTMVIHEAGIAEFPAAETVYVRDRI